MKILILASNPRKDLNLDDEIRDLQNVIEKSRNRQEFEVEIAPAVRVGDLQDLLFRYRPQIVHFCGHGSGQQGLVFKGKDGGEQWVRAEALSDLFRLFSSQVGCVLLNACYSEEQANAIVNHIDYVIGMNQEIRDDAAIAFAKGFYQALGYECSIEQAYEFGKNAIQLEISGSSKMRSVTTEAQRKAEVVDAIQKIVIPEHLKPILRKKQIQTPLSIPTTPLSSETRTAIHLDVAQAVTKISSVKQDNAPRLPQLLLSGLLVFFIPVISIYGHSQWQRHQLEQSVLQQDQNILQQAIELAKQKKLGDAISVLDKIPANSAVATQSQDYLEEWSRQLLDRAEGHHAIGKINEALMDVHSIPTSNSRIYDQAQTKIKVLVEDRQTLDKIVRDLKEWNIDSAKSSLNDLQNLKLQKQEKSRIDAKAKEKEQSDKLLATQLQGELQALLDSKKHRDDGELDEALMDAQSIPKNSPHYKEARVEYKALIEDIATLNKIDDALHVWDIGSPVRLLKDLKNPKLQKDVERRLDETKNKIQEEAKRRKQKAEDNSQLNQPSPSEDPRPNGQGYKYAWLSEREVTDADLKGKTVNELVIMRNSIYARHRFIFKSDEIREVFNKEPWYKAISPEVGNMLSSLEKENVKKIQAREGK